MKKQDFTIFIIFISTLFFISCQKDPLSSLLDKRIVKEQRIVKQTNDSILVNYAYDNANGLITKKNEVGTSLFLG